MNSDPLNPSEFSLNRDEGTCSSESNSPLVSPFSNSHRLSPLVGAWYRTSKFPRSLLIYGIGNIGRGDDGLGILFAETLAQRQTPPLSWIEFQCNYQLNIEDALEVKDRTLVVFVDASKHGSLPETHPPYSLKQLQPHNEMTFSTHALSFESVLAIAEDFYGARPTAYLLSIPGTHWDIHVGLSDEAQKNLNEALNDFQRLIDHFKKIDLTLI